MTCLHSAPIVTSKCTEDATVQFVLKRRCLSHVFGQYSYCRLIAEGVCMLHAQDQRDANTAVFASMLLEVAVYRLHQRERDRAACYFKIFQTLQCVSNKKVSGDFNMGVGALAVLQSP